MKARMKPEPFAFAADLPDAYRELSEAIASVVELQDRGPVPFAAQDVRNVPFLAESVIWNNADAMVAAYDRLASAARRVHVAKVGPKEAPSRDGFVRRAAR